MLHVIISNRLSGNPMLALLVQHNRSNRDPVDGPGGLHTPVACCSCLKPPLGRPRGFAVAGNVRVTMAWQGMKGHVDGCRARAFHCTVCLFRRGGDHGGRAARGLPDNGGAFLRGPGVLGRGGAPGGRGPQAHPHRRLLQGQARSRAALHGQAAGGGPPCEGQIRVHGSRGREAKPIPIDGFSRDKLVRALRLMTKPQVGTLVHRSALGI